MKQFFVYSLTLALTLLHFSAQSGEANTSIVKCWAGEYTNQYIILRIVNGNIVKWDNNHIARKDSNSSFGLFSEPLDDGPVEAFKFGKAKNGYRFVRVVTSAESITVGISPSLTQGFCAYQDLGSGNGNDRIPISCREL